MLTKMKLALVLCGTLISGVAAAQPAGKEINAKRIELKQKHAEMHKQQLQKFDLDHNGTLDANERTAMHDQRVEKLFAKLDTNKDGSISLTELKAGKRVAMGRRGFGHHRGKGNRGFHGGAGPKSK